MFDGLAKVLTFYACLLILAGVAIGYGISLLT